MHTLFFSVTEIVIMPKINSVQCDRAVPVILPFVVLTLCTTIVICIVLLVYRWVFKLFLNNGKFVYWYVAAATSFYSVYFPVLPQNLARSLAHQGWPSNSLFPHSFFSCLNCCIATSEAELQVYRFNTCDIKCTEN